MDLQVGIIQVAVRTTRNGRQLFDISCSDGKTRAVWEDALANALNAFAGSGAILTVRVKVTQNGQYTNESITAFAPPGQALPPEAAGGGPIQGGGGGPRGGGRPGGGGMSPEDKTRISKMGAQGSAATIVAALFSGAGPEAYAEAVELHEKLTKKLYQSARSHEKPGQEAADGATVLQPGAAAPTAGVLPAGQPVTPAAVAAVVPGVVVGAAALPPGGAADATAAADVVAQASAEAGDGIDWD